jgi:glycosyltransferase involved in cell wall biosynthesis
MTSGPRYSLIIPAYNEEAYLPRLLDTVDRARARYRHGTSAIEVIVVDNGSTDGTARIARDRGCRVVAIAKRIIGASRNGGARAARGEVLAFVDADAQLHADTFNEIDRVLTDDVIGGTTGVRFERWSVGLACTHVLLVAIGVAIRGIRARHDLNVDTGVVFCRKTDFDAIGGYTEERLFAEDVRFLLDLRRLARRRGQRVTRGTNAKTIWSTRKFDAYGDWHYFTMPPRLVWGMLRGDNRLARRYWYEAR